LNWFEAVIIGAVQGLTEFIPISSTAHVRIVPALFGWKDPGAAVTAVTQLGTLAAVLIYFRTDLVHFSRAAVVSVFSYKRRNEWDERTWTDVRMAWFIAIGTIPIGICGILLKDMIETEFRSLTIIAGSMIGLAVLLAVAEWTSIRRRTVNEMGFLDTQAIGWAQALALIPGVSRSGVTITAGLFIGLKREAAARFSFLLSIPAVLASGLFELKDLLEKGLGGEGLGNLILATVVAAIVGYASIAFLIKWLQTRSTLIFILYRITLGILIFYMVHKGIIV
jgi:undecaprenyl-diphosphatase